MIKDKPILITGAHRSGSTWIGRMLNGSGVLYSVHEPFNIQLRKEINPIQYWFQYIDCNTTQVTQDKIKRFLSSLYVVSLKQLIKDMKAAKNSRAAYKVLLDTKNRLLKRVMFKDPIALLSAPWIYENYSCKVIVSIRHPAAFVASLKVKNWNFVFNHFVEQPILMDTLLSKFKPKIIEYAKQEQSIVDQGILVWNCFYHIVHIYQMKYKDEWCFITHEELSRNPIEAFKKIFQFAEISFTEKAKKVIRASTNPLKSTEFNRKSIENITSWKNRLTKEEIDKIKIGTEKVWKYFYTESDW